jgi:protein tyrosine phosphatase (PTP) superfamily phosphohydrolase (DUF442 family)
MVSLIAASALCISCTSTKQEPAAASPDAKPTIIQAHALHNVHEIDSMIYSGAQPDDDAAFDELKSMGIKTIISVDGSTPNVEKAKARGFRYVHIPITYAEVSDDERIEIARAIRDLPGPVYVHCHHGKHRGPAAAAAAAITLGRMTGEQGVAFMKLAGTAPNYTGLYACVAAATPEPQSVIDAAPHDFPPIHKPEGIVAAMVDADVTLANLEEIHAAGWTVPTDNPDLVPASEAGRLVDLLRYAGEDHRAKAEGADFAGKLNAGIAAATALEDAIVANAPAAALDQKFKLLNTACNTCHAVYRNKRDSALR